MTSSLMSEMTSNRHFDCRSDAACCTIHSFVYNYVISSDVIAGDVISGIVLIKQSVNVFPVRQSIIQNIVLETVRHPNSHTVKKVRNWKHSS